MGAGLIGLEVGVGLMERGLKVTIVEMLPQILPQLLDADMAKHGSRTPGRERHDISSQQRR